MSSERCKEITSASRMCPFSVWDLKALVGIYSGFEEGRVRRSWEKEGKGFDPWFVLSFMVVLDYQITAHVFRTAAKNIFQFVAKLLHTTYK
jgi:hypothetical protein